METVNNHPRTALDITATGLTAKFAETSVAIKAYAKKHDYKLNGLDGETGLLALENVSAHLFQAMSQNARKKTARRLRRFEMKPTMSNANKLLAFLHRAATSAITTFKAPKAELRFGDKELAIRAARVRFVETRNAATRARLEYKAIKSDFYKNQLAK